MISLYNQSVFHGLKMIITVSQYNHLIVEILLKFTKQFHKLIYIRVRWV